MKTPIPEKIKIIRIPVSKLDKDLYSCIKTNNSLIDVLTEQQDRLDRHNDRIAETNKHFGNNIKDLQKEIEGLKGCIRSHAIIAHGELKEPEYCKCKDPFPCHPISEEFNCGKCHACDKPVKPQPYTAMRSTGEKIADEQENREKQMREDMRIVLDEFWMNGKEAGYLMKYDNVITTDTVINKILAIVKGE